MGQTLLQQALEYVTVMAEEVTTGNPEMSSGTENTGTRGETTEEVELGIEMTTEIGAGTGLLNRGRDHLVWVRGRDTGSGSGGVILWMIVIGERGAVWTELIVLHCRPQTTHLLPVEKA